MTSLIATGLVAGYGSENVLEGLSFDVASGGLLGILGPNGAGKTTLLKALAGLLRVKAGAVCVGGVDMTRLKPERRARAGLILVPEGRRLFTGLTVVENLRVGGLTGRTGMSPSEVFDLFPRLADRRQSLAGQLSGGEQQMLAIGRALCGGPDVLLVDEPSLGLAPKIVASVFAAFSELTKRGMTICLGEQNVTAAVEVTDRCLVLDHGRVVFDGATTDAQSRQSVANAYSRTVELRANAEADHDATPPGAAETQ